MWFVLPPNSFGKLVQIVDEKLFCSGKTDLYISIKPQMHPILVKIITFHPETLAAVGPPRIHVRCPAPNGMFVMGISLFSSVESQVGFFTTSFRDFGILPSIKEIFTGQPSKSNIVVFN